MTVALVCGCALAGVAAAAYFATGWYVRNSAPDTVRQAEQHLRRRENAEARETLAWLLHFDPHQHRALLITGVSLNADKRFPEAIEVLDRVGEESESFEQAGIALASSLTFDGQFERAERVLSRHLARFPDSADGRNRLVRLYLKELRERDALQLLLERWRQFPDDTLLLPDLLELEAGDVTPHDSLPDLVQADAGHPHQLPVVRALARAYALMGRNDEARTRFREALELGPDDPDTRVLAAEFHLDCGEFDMARSLLDEADVLTHDGIDDRYWLLRSRLAEQSGDPSDALELLNNALRARPNDEVYLLMQAGLLRRSGEVDQAQQASRQATRLAEARKQLLILSKKLDRNQPHPVLCRDIADVLERLGRPTQADGWRRVGRAVEQANRAGVSPSPLPPRESIESGAP